MDDRRFDALTRTISSRRTAMAGLLGGVAALLGLAGQEDADAHNYLARCRRLRDPVQRHFCLRRARNHNRWHRRCRSVTRAEVCADRVACGPVHVGCGRVINCPCQPAGYPLPGQRGVRPAVLHRPRRQAVLRELGAVQLLRLS